MKGTTVVERRTKEQRRTDDPQAVVTLQKEVTLLKDVIKSIDQRLEEGASTMAHQALAIDTLKSGLSLNTDICNYNRMVVDRTERKVDEHITKMDEVLNLMTTMKGIDKISMGGAKRVGILGASLVALAWAVTKTQEFWHYIVK